LFLVDESGFCVVVDGSVVISFAVISDGAFSFICFFPMAERIVYSCDTGLKGCPVIVAVMLACYSC